MEMKNEGSIDSRVLMRFLMGFMLVLGLFLFELGISQIALAGEARCRENLESGRLLSTASEKCMSEGIYYFLQALSRGPFATAHSEVPNALAWILTGGVYGVIGGFLTLLAQKWAVGIFLGIHALALVILTFIAYISNYIV
jgi:hypothetical protein